MHGFHLCGGWCAEIDKNASATPANSAASSGLSTIVGEAPADSSTLATKFAETTLVRHCTNGRRCLSARCAATTSSIPGAWAADSATGILNDPFLTASFVSTLFIH
jgi:hypothetical protein